MAFRSSAVFSSHSLHKRPERGCGLLSVSWKILYRRNGVTIHFILCLLRRGCSFSNLECGFEPSRRSARSFRRRHHPENGCKPSSATLGSSSKIERSLSRRHPNTGSSVSSAHQNQSTLFDLRAPQPTDPKYSYLLLLSIGTPPQHSLLSLDTGSAELVQNSLDSDWCFLSHNDCGAFTSYNKSNSSSAHVLGNAQPVTIYYGSEMVYTDQYNETVSLGNDTLHNFTINLASDYASHVGGKVPTFGFLGLGQNSSQALAPGETSSSNPSFLAALQKAGYVKSQAYSLYLGGCKS